jgi:hypothetical protein
MSLNKQNVLHLAHQLCILAEMHKSNGLNHESNNN